MSLSQKKCFLGFHQYLQSKQSSLFSTENEQTQRSQRIALEIQVLAWDRHKNVTGLNQLTLSS